ncbi:glycosyltransferase family 4 protein [Arcanobacterium haemolyticum]|nr:glycosyltransferase family 4 protein [Arcanobacterium haemolyticum]
MRIAIIVNNYPPKVGGVEFHAANLARYLVELGHDVTVLTIASTPGSRTEHGVRVLTDKAHLPLADVITVPSIGARRRITAFLKRNQIDLVSIHTRFFPMSFVGLRAAQKAGVPVIHTEHGSGYVASNSPVISLGSRMVDWTMGRYILRHADRVLGVSEKVTEFVQSLSGVRAAVFYNAITPSKHQGKIADRPSHLVFVGRMVEGKGWDTFIDAIASLRKSGFDVDGELIGGGPFLDRARDLIQTRGLTDVINVLGRVEPNEVRTRLAGATLVNPTILSEGFQTTIVEALAERGRVVTFDVPGAHMLRDKGAPVVVTPEKTTPALVEALRALLHEPPAPARGEIVKPFTWPEQARHYAEICSDVVSRHTHA